MRSPFRSASGAVSGGLQVASVKASTSLRTKKRGKVPPRLDTLEVISSILGVEVGDIKLTWQVKSCRFRQ